MADCNGDGLDGCEASLLIDPRNCGACGSLCAPIPHGQNGCENGMCRIGACDAGWADCDGVLVNGCETHTNTDGKNCGKCGNVCGQTLVCSNGGCTCQTCILANAKSVCLNLICVVAACLPGYGDCDGIANNGCESVTAGDANNCGACGVVCGGNTPFCQGGVCSKVGASCAAILMRPRLPELRLEPKQYQSNRKWDKLRKLLRAQQQELGLEPPLGHVGQL